ncbi:response regulator [Helicobacter mesocricetorum]|uniref:response regulator n=1 Tax=Helicobacter mesocricetorum TaxID=87012 RepID=UPI000CF0F7BE|nr:response regulator [Helicobacter mesocricetorum]
MKILIVENEIYLAQSIATKLNHLGFDCENISSVKEALNIQLVDIILLSTNIAGEDFYPLIEKFQNAIIILMIPYVNDDTVTFPLQAGASDYIVKPFMIDELIRKIKHFTSYKRLQKEISFYKDYFCNSLINPNYAINTKISFPLIIKSVSQKTIDTYVINYAFVKKLSINFHSLYKTPKFQDYLKSISKQQLNYIIGFETLTKDKREEFLKKLKNAPIILSCLGEEIESLSNVHQINIKNIPQSFEEDILSVDEYVKTTILKFEDKYPDTELSKKLGMSRKSLWEKRKKYGIAKKK